ncbi:uncharacterized protein JCM6883_002673 [Sporobolomyces salmoneus]|uniref:uncharacterized protein n=1 Tax=Sporobolomyces salmoneus TaxID=183962 RepID=UPI0031735829
MPMRSYRLETRVPAPISPHTSDYLDGEEVVTIKDPSNGRLIWSKTRSLTEDEIVSTILDSLHSPRFTLHRPRQAVSRSTSKSSPPWPRYLVLRSPNFPDNQYIPLIDSDEATSKKSKKEDEDSNTLEFKLTIPTRETKGRSPRPAALNLAAISTTSLQDEGEENPFTPTQASHSSTQKKKSRPKSSSYRLDMAPSLSHESTSSTTSTIDPRYPLSEPTSPTSDVSSLPNLDQNQLATFRLRPFLPPALLEQLQRTNPTSLGRRVLNRVRSLLVEEGKQWSCVWTKNNESSETAPPSQAESKERVLMYFEEDPPTLFPSPSKGTLTVSTELIDESGYEPSFWISVAMAWMELEEEREGWREGRGGD